MINVIVSIKKKTTPEDLLGVVQYLTDIGFTIHMKTEKWLSAGATQEILESVFKSKIKKYFSDSYQDYWKWEPKHKIPKEISKSVDGILFNSPMIDL